MALSQTELWTAAGVLIAALGAGYLIGKDANQATVDKLTSEVQNLEKLNQNIGVSKFLDIAAQTSAELGEKLLQRKKIEELNQKNNDMKTEIEAISVKIKEKDADLVNLRSEISKLKSIVQKDFSELSEINVKSNNMAWISPQKVGLAVGVAFTGTAYVTVTGVASNKEMKLGERLDIKTDDRNCFIILTAAKTDEAQFSFACTNKN